MTRTALLCLLLASPAWCFEMGDTFTARNTPICRDKVDLVRTADLYDKDPAKGVSYVTQRSKFIGTDGQPACFIAFRPVRLTIVGYLGPRGDNFSYVAVKYQRDEKHYLAVVLVGDKPKAGKSL